MLLESIFFTLSIQTNSIKRWLVTILYLYLSIMISIIQPVWKVFSLLFTSIIVSFNTARSYCLSPDKRRICCRFPLECFTPKPNYYISYQSIQSVFITSKLHKAFHFGNQFSQIRLFFFSSMFRLIEDIFYTRHNYTTGLPLQLEENKQNLLWSVEIFL